MKKMYKKGGAKKKKKYANGGPTPSGISNFYGKVDSFLDAALPGRQARQDKRADRKAIRLENRDARKKLRNAVRQENALKKIEAKRMSKGGSALETGSYKYGGSCGKSMRYNRQKKSF